MTLPLFAPDQTAAVAAAARRSFPRNDTDWYADPPRDELTDFTFKSVGYSIYTRQMLMNGRLPYVIRGFAHTKVQRVNPDKQGEGQQSVQPDALKTPVFRDGSDRGLEKPGEPTETKQMLERPSRTNVGDSLGHQGGSETIGFWHQVLRRTMQSGQHIAFNFPQKFREHAVAHVAKAQDMPGLMAKFANKSVKMAGKIVTALSAPPGEDKEKK